MTDRRRGLAARALRGGVAGVVTTLLALAFHVVGGGAAPGPGAIALSLAAAIWAGVLIGRARPSLPLLVTAVATAQLVLHAVFAMSTGDAALGGGGHAEHGLLVVHAHAGGAMWQAHLLAAILTVVAVRRGERAGAAVLRAARLVVRIGLRRLAPPNPALPPRAVPSAFGSAPKLAWVLDPVASSLVRRGPPALAG